MIKISVANNFAIAPGGRYRDQGPMSGQQFREEFLEKYFVEPGDEIIEIDLDGVYGFATSFLEECFGGLARKFGRDVVKKRIKVTCQDEPMLIKEIESYIEKSDE